MSQPAREPASTAGRRLWPGVADAAALLGFAVAAFLIYRPLWMDLERGYLSSSVQDQNMWEWFFAVTAHSVANLENPLSSTLQNFPLGVNLMSNTVMLGVGVPLTPVTLAFGPTVTWALALTGGLAGTAAAWYWVLSRHIVRTRIGSAVGGAFCAFAPPIISHANAHPNFVVLFVLPLIVLWLLKLARGERPVRNGVILGLLLAYQVFLGEEPLLIAATTLLVFAGVYALSRPEETLERARPLGIGLGVAAGVALVLVAFPLWWQFSGPQSYSTLEHGFVGNDAAAFTTFATESVAANAEAAKDLSLNRTEENAFFGWPLVILMVVVTVWLWRVAAARAVAVAMFAMAWLSMGVLLVVDGTATSIPGPWLLLFDRPLFDSVLESRFALGCVPAIGILLAMGTERALRLGGNVPEWRLTWRVVWFGALVLALVPIAPTELRVGERDVAPAFFTGGLWRDHIEQGGSLVVAPLPDTGDAEALHWQVEAGFGFALVEGYFVGPGTDGRGRYGALRRPTSELLEEADESGTVPQITAEDRAAAAEDLRYWRADAVVVRAHAGADPVRRTVELLLGRAGQVIGGVHLWDLRPPPTPS
nr:glycosyl transferase [Qaidamihabitans albus]